MGTQSAISVEDSLKFLRCPDCSSELRVVAPDGDAGLLCLQCGLAFPRQNGVIFLLDCGSRNRALEVPLITRLLAQCSAEDETKACERTLDLLSNCGQDTKVCERDGNYSDEYKKRFNTGREKNWNDRNWQREPQLDLAKKHLTQPTARQPKVVLDIGCGEGQDFRSSLSPVLSEEDIYIALDVSLPGLLLNRKLNPHSRALYILASADSPPLKGDIADVVLCFGMLHHMQAKERGLSTLSRFVRNGIILLSTRISAPVLSSLTNPMGRSEVVREGKVNYGSLKDLIEQENLSVIYENPNTGVFYIVLMKFLRSILINSKTLYNFVNNIDGLFVAVLGRYVHFFHYHGLSLVLEKRS